MTFDWMRFQRSWGEDPKTELLIKSFESSAADWLSIQPRVEYLAEGYPFPKTGYGPLLPCVQTPSRRHLRGRLSTKEQDLQRVKSESTFANG